MFQQIAYALPPIPGIPEFDSLGPKTYAAWPVWRDSTTSKVKFWPWLKKREAAKLYHRARQFERQTRQPRKQDGALGRNGLLVLHALIFDFLNYKTGRLDPAIESIAKKAAISVSSVKRGLANLKSSGVLGWIRRAAETRDKQGRFCLEQDTNAYGIRPVSQWLGFVDDQPEAPPPDPSAWGATPPLPSVIEQADEELKHGARKTALALLDCAPGDELAATLASLGRAIQERENLNENR